MRKLRQIVLLLLATLAAKAQSNGVDWCSPGGSKYCFHIRMSTVDNAIDVTDNLGAMVTRVLPNGVEAITSGTTDPRGLMNSQYQSGNYAAALLLRKAGGTYASPSAITNGHTVGVVLFSAWNGSVWQYPAYITAQANVSGSNIGADVHIAVRAPGGSLVERVNVMGSGLVYLDSTSKLLVGTGTDDGSGGNIQSNGFMSAAVGYYSANSSVSTVYLPNGGVLAKNLIAGDTFTNYIKFGKASPQIDASLLGAEFTISGSSSVNGNIVLNPGAVAGSASVVINPGHVDQPGLLVKNMAGTTTSDAIQVRNSAGDRVFGIVGSGDANYPGTLEVVTTGSLDPRGLVNTQYNSNNFAAALLLRKSGGTIASPAAITNGHTIGVVLFSAWNGTLWQFPAYITAQSLVSGSNIGAGLHFATRSPGGSLIEHFVIADTGAITADAGATITAPSSSAPGVVIQEFTSSTSGNTFEVKDSGGTLFFKIIGSHDSGAPGTVVARSIFPNSTTPNAYSIGDTNHRYKIWGADFDANGTLTLSAITGSTQCLQVNSSGVIAGSGSGCGGSSYTGTSPIVVSGTAISCPTCLLASGSYTISGVWNFGSALSISANQFIDTSRNATLTSIQAASGAFNFNGATSSNGNILLTPGNVAGNSTVYVNGTRTDTPSFVVKNPSGTTTSDAFEIQDNGGTVVFRVIGSTDSGAPNTVATQDIAPLGTSGVRKLGNSGHYWSEAYVNLYYAGGSAGLSTTKTVRASGGLADCTLIYTGGILTGGSC